MMFLLGREWHAEYYSNRVREGFRADYLRQDVERALESYIKYGV